jgi:ribosome maturation factor RimP
VDIRNCADDTSLDDCERMSRALEEQLDALDLIPDSYVLEISSPGISRELTTDREFISFKGFSVIVKTSEPVEGHTEWRGKLIRRDDTGVYLKPERSCARHSPSTDYQGAVGSKGLNSG